MGYISKFGKFNEITFEYKYVVRVLRDFVTALIL